MGNIFLYGAIFLTLLAIILVKYRVLKWIVLFQFLASLGMAVILLWALLGNNFAIRYVFHHSSKALPWYYKISALWAGDSGSLILWLVIVSAIGFFICIKKNTEPPVLLTLLVFQLFILASIFVTTPFAIASKTYIDGQGMNLLLRNFWMMSHPPMIFISYALLIVPFGLLIQYAFNKNTSFSQWKKQVTPWILASWLFLGLGIVLGAIWSYEVIGWGGYWGWDPVENASLIPWLLMSGALHALVVSKSSKTNNRSVVGFTLASFVSMIIAVFITRSGILADVSVHSFSGKPISIILTVLLFISIIFSIFLYIKLYKREESGVEPPLMSRLFVVGAGNLVILLFSIIVLVATLWPVFSGFFGEGQVISRHFYSIILAPVGILLSLGLAVVPFLKWSETDLRKFVKRMIGPMFLGIVAIWILFEIGVNGPLFVILTFLTVVAISASFIQMSQIPVKRYGAYIAHIGLAILVVGIVISSNFQSSQQVNLAEGGEAKLAVNWSLTLDDFSITDESGDYTAKITAEDMNGKITSSKIIGLMDNRGSWVVTPSIKRSISHDVIISPGRPEPGILLAPSVSESVSGNGYEFSLVSLDKDNVNMKISFEGDEWEFSSSRVEDGSFEMAEPTEGLSIFLEEVGNDYVRARITDLRPDVGKTVLLPVTLSVKYLISFVWIGMLITLLGILWALFFRLKPKKKNFISAESVNE
jgi:cytochrome c-type biogenesis protein CcmF